VSYCPVSYVLSCYTTYTVGPKLVGSTGPGVPGCPGEPCVPRAPDTLATSPIFAPKSSITARDTTIDTIVNVLLTFY